MPPPLPAITGFYTGLGALLLLFLAGRVAGMRYKLRVGLGDGGRPELQQAIRAHGNTVEWLLPAALLLLLAELTRAGPLFLHACGLALVVGRLLHAFGLSRTPGASFGRFVGSLLSWGAVLVLALWNVWTFLRLALV